MIAAINWLRSSWAWVLGSLIVGFLILLWRALVGYGRIQAEHARAEKDAAAARDTHRRIDDAVAGARGIDRDDRARWLREYAERVRGGPL